MSRGLRSGHQNMEQWLQGARTMIKQRSALNLSPHTLENLPELAEDDNYTIGRLMPLYRPGREALNSIRENSSNYYNKYITLVHQDDKQVPCFELSLSIPPNFLKSVGE